MRPALLALLAAVLAVLALVLVAAVALAARRRDRFTPGGACAEYRGDLRAACESARAACGFLPEGDGGACRAAVGACMPVLARRGFSGLTAAQKFNAVAPCLEAVAKISPGGLAGALRRHGVPGLPPGAYPFFHDEETRRNVAALEASLLEWGLDLGDRLGGASPPP